MMPGQSWSQTLVHAAIQGLYLGFSMPLVTILPSSAQPLGQIPDNFCLENGKVLPTTLDDL